MGYKNTPSLISKVRIIRYSPQAWVEIGTPLEGKSIIMKSLNTKYYVMVLEHELFEYADGGCYGILFVKQGSSEQKRIVENLVGCFFILTLQKSPDKRKN